MDNPLSKELWTERVWKAGDFMMDEHNEGKTYKQSGTK